MRATRQGGFTLIEVMIVVALVAIIAAVAIRYLGGAPDAARATEVHAMFAQIKQRQQEYHNEFNTYVSTGTGDTDFHPGPVTGQPRDVAPLPTSWQWLRITPPKTALYCGYVTIAGPANDGANIGGTANTFGFGGTPTTDWYYIIAECDFDDDSAVNSQYFTHSGTTVTNELNPGK